MRKLVSAALCAALLAAAGGCGSSNDSGSTSAQTPVATAGTPLPTTTTNSGSNTSAAAQHKAFLKRVNPICEDYNRSIRRVQKELAAVGKSGNVDVYAPPLKRATAAARRASSRFDALKPPSAETDQAALIGRALKAQTKGNKLLLDAALADDETQFSVANQALQQDVTPKLQALMRSYGMTVCGAAG